MSSLLKSDVWLLLILAAAFAAILVKGQPESNTAKPAALFTILGDALVLSALYHDGKQDEASLS